LPVACCLLPVACCLLPVACCLLPVAIGLKHFSINGTFIWPLTVPHLPVNAPCRGAVVGVCLLDFDLWLFFCPVAVLSLMGLSYNFLAVYFKRKSVKNWEKARILGDSAPLGVNFPRQGWRGETSKCGAKRILYGGKFFKN
jgi:hypothetical protein